MGLLAIISGISTIASLLSIFFDVDKIHINTKKFVLLLSIVCLAVFSIASINSKKNSEDHLDDSATGYSIDDSDSGNLKDEEKDDSSDSEALSDTYINESEEPHEETIDTKEETDGDKGIFKIDPIISNTYNAVAIEDSPFEIQPNEIIGFSGEVASDGQCNDYL